MGLRSVVPIALSQSLHELPDELCESPDLPVSPLLKQRRWARISWRYAREYRKGASGHAVLEAVKAQSRHRDTNDRRSRPAKSVGAYVWLRPRRGAERRATAGALLGFSFTRLKRQRT